MRIFVLIAAIAVVSTGVANWLSNSVSEGNKDAAQQQAAMAAAKPIGQRIVALKSDQRGHFSTDISVNDRFVKALVDTGASVVAFSHEDAAKAGITPKQSDYTVKMQTANGIVHAARVRIPELRLQSITVRDVEATVLPPGALHVTLLGMSFLKRLSSFEMNGSSLVLKQ